MTTAKAMMTLTALLMMTACRDAQRDDFTKERNTVAYQEALGSYGAGRLDAAEEGFLSVIKSDPSNASARFQLAVLLQDSRKDYLGAICNYRDYLILAPTSDKAPLARERAKNCERLLGRQLADKLNLTDNGEIVEELKLALAAKDKAEATVTEFAGQIESLKRELEVVKKESAQRKALLDRLGGDDEDDTPPKRATVVRPASAVKEEVRPVADVTAQVARAAALVSEETDDVPRTAPQVPQVEEPEKELTLNPAALALHEEEEAEEASTLLPKHLNPDEIRAAKSARAAEAEARRQARLTVEPQQIPAQTSRPKTRVVREHETLSQIATEVYGNPADWRKIQAANKAVVSINGDVKAGTVLVLP